jgi:glycerol-3-phosphate dehydrogenase
VAYAALEEMAITPEDFLSRRTPIAVTDPALAEEVHEEVGRLLERFME